ncbi:NAD(P)-binding protein [Sistotremastrum niveocremeum HHB9708]|uniref:NAD(P)-binding protein n=1 Tax=Sistotremastrum niveocremeum HHB9708 TaxID=1314777 RepID=A0A164N4Z1_9AGAM|nr:NAD(P)-binding protein [Sistotremastrum niveocremeum HHB9708]
MGKVLVTGGSGFVATHVVHKLLRNGHHVTATVRSSKKGDQMIALVPENLRANFVYVIVEDVGLPGAFDKVIQENDFDGVIHTATPFDPKIQDPQATLKPAIEGTTNILEAAHKYGPNIRKMVITSSCASVISEEKGDWPGHVYTEADWNPITWEAANDGSWAHAYYGAKTYAEKSAWKFLEEQKPNFEVVTICPPYIFGPALQHLDSLDAINTSNALLYSYINGSLKGKEIQKNGVHLWVDVRDCADAHVVAYEKQGLGSHRFVIAAGTFTNKEVADIFREKYPDRASNVPTKLAEGLTPEGEPVGGKYSVDNSKSRKLLGLEYLPIEQSIVDLMTSLKPLESKA